MRWVMVPSVDDTMASAAYQTKKGTPAASIIIVIGSAQAHHAGRLLRRRP